MRTLTVAGIFVMVSSLSACQDKNYITPKEGKYVHLWKAKTCKGLIDHTPGNCYRRAIEYLCCGSCQKVKNPARPDCKYGDRLAITNWKDMTVMTCREYVAQFGWKGCKRNDMKKGCCKTCSEIPGKNAKSPGPAPFPRLPRPGQDRFPGGSSADQTKQLRG